MFECMNLSVLFRRIKENNDNGQEKYGTDSQNQEQIAYFRHSQSDDVHWLIDTADYWRSPPAMIRCPIPGDDPLET